MTHPVQYMSPWFRHLEREREEIRLTVVYAIMPTADEQGGEYGVSFTWDVPVCDGYRHKALQNQKGKRNASSDSFLGINAPSVTTAIDATNPDVVLIPGWHSATLLRALLHCRRRKIPVLYRGDTNLSFTPQGARSTIWRARTACLLRLYSGYLAVGARSRSYLARFSVPRSRVFWSPHCVHNSYYRERAQSLQDEGVRADARIGLGLSPDDYCLLYVGKMKESKGILDLIHATRILDGDVHLLMVGSGDGEARARLLAKDLGVRVSWLGFRNQSELPRLYASADCFVLPSRSPETWGLVVNESLAVGTPCVVTSAVGCGPDLVHSGRTGERCPAASPRQLSQALARVRSAGRSRSAWTHDCIEQVSKYAYTVASHGLVEACQHVLGHRTRPRRASAPRCPQATSPSALRPRRVQKQPEWNRDVRTGHHGIRRPTE